MDTSFIIGHMIDGTNKRIMRLVRDAAFLFWLTDENIYAEFAEAVFFTYIDGMYHREAPIDLDNSICGKTILYDNSNISKLHKSRSLCRNY